MHGWQHQRAIREARVSHERVQFHGDHMTPSRGLSSGNKGALTANEELLVQYCMRGLEAQNRGDMAGAVEKFGQALRIAPDNLDMRLLLAFAQGSNGDRQSASNTLRDTPKLATLSEADARRVADAATTLGADSVALIAVERALVTAPSDPNLHSTLGALHHRTGDTEKASVVLHRAQVRWPQHVPTLMNRARLLADTGDYGDALALYDGVLQIMPEHAHARWYRGLLRLTLGDLAAGWSDHEARRELPFMQSVTPNDIAPWRGESLQDRTILLWGEQGLGDQIMGARFATILAQRGANVIVRCASSLMTMMRSVAGVSDVIAAGDAVPECDFHVPMLSVPFLTGLAEDASVDGASYMSPPSIVSAEMPVARNMKGRARVAVVWAGSSTHANDHNRSFPAGLLAKLLAGADVDWLSLQLSDRSRDLDVLEPVVRSRVTDASAQIADFSDTARLLASCNMLVSVDTSVAHLAGALGVPTVAMIPCVPDWRWQLARRDTPWYRSMRLVRQPMAGAWDHVIAEVHRAVNSGTV